MESCVPADTIAAANEIAARMDALLANPAAARVAAIINRMAEIEKESRELGTEFIEELKNPELSEGRDILIRLTGLTANLMPVVGQQMAAVTDDAKDRFIEGLKRDLNCIEESPSL